METLQGHLLIAVPHLPDANFFRSVVLVIQHDEEGASGLILNRPSNVSLSDVWSEISDNPVPSDTPINIGGPVQGPLMALHDCILYSESQVLEGVYLSVDRENIDRLVARDDINLRLFSGYSGWAPGQLENELRVGGWLTAPAEAEHVYLDPTDLWKVVCEEIGKEILLPDLRRSNMPSDPSVN